MTQQQLLDTIQAYRFAIIEVAMFLDSQPNHAQALEYYHQCREMLKEAMDQYEENYGPLSIFGNLDQNTWQWSTTPWPWEMEA